MGLTQRGGGGGGGGGGNSATSMMASPSRSSATSSNNKNALHHQHSNASNNTSTTNASSQATTTTNSLQHWFYALDKRDRDHVKIGLILSVYLSWIFVMGGFRFLSAEHDPFKDLASTILYHPRMIKQRHLINNSTTTSFVADGYKLQLRQKDPYTLQRRDVAAFNLQWHLNGAQLHYRESQLEDVEEEVLPPTVYLQTIGTHRLVHNVTVLDLMTARSSIAIPQPPPTVRIVGEILLEIHLHSISRGLWMGSFTLPPLPGTYQLEATWHHAPCQETAKTGNINCQVIQSRQVQLELRTNHDEKNQHNIMNDNNHIPALLNKKEQSASVPTWKNFASLFPPGNLWVHQRHLKNLLPSDYLIENQKPHQSSESNYPQHGQAIVPQEYIWVNAEFLQDLANNKANDQHKDIPTWGHATTRGMLGPQEYASTLHLPSSLLEPAKSWYQSFSELSNYEVVCWMGPPSTSQQLMAAFLSLRKPLFPAQRPFKFHYHPMTSWQHVDHSWSDDLKGKFKKCKHLFVSLDAVSLWEDASQQTPMLAIDYKQRVVHFLHQLLLAIPDSTFPIWILTQLQEAPWQSHQHCYTSSPTNEEKAEEDASEDDVKQEDHTNTINAKTQQHQRLLRESADAASRGDTTKQEHHDNQGMGDRKDNRQLNDSNTLTKESSNNNKYDSMLFHPCDKVLFDIIDRKHYYFPAQHTTRIRLMNNTDVTMTATSAFYPSNSVNSNAGITSSSSSSLDMTTTTTTSGSNNNADQQKEELTHYQMHPRRTDVMGVIALRIYVLIGKQVQEWRQVHHQIGKIDGLHRNGVVEPNIDLTPFVWE